MTKVTQTEGGAGATGMKMRVTGASVQEVGTPRAFIDAVEKRIGAIAWDLAANETKHVVDGYFGPGSSYGDDAFRMVWHARHGLLWLNPPYENIPEWARRAAAEAGHGAHIAMLIPAAIGTNYFREWIWPFARVYALSPRLTFVGHATSYPKDLILCEYGPNVALGFECWRWK